MNYNLEEYKNAFIELIYEHNIKDIVLGEKYYVAQWSLSPMSEGNIVTELIIRQEVNVNGIITYFTMSSNRCYQGYQIHETRDEAQKVANFMNEIGYVGEKVRSDTLRELGVTQKIANNVRNATIEKSLKEKGYFIWY